MIKHVDSLKLLFTNSSISHPVFLVERNFICSSQTPLVGLSFFFSFWLRFFQQFSLFKTCSYLFFMIKFLSLLFIREISKTYLSWLCEESKRQPSLLVWRKNDVIFCVFDYLYFDQRFSPYFINNKGSWVYPFVDTSKILLNFQSNWGEGDISSCLYQKSSLRVSLLRHPVLWMVHLWGIMIPSFC